MEITTLIDKLNKENQIERVANNPFSQFGTKTKPLPGATLLPERRVPENIYRESGIKWRTFAAQPSTRYSPVTLVEGALASSFMVELGESDLGMTLDAKEFDLFRRELNAGSMEAAARRVLDLGGRVVEGLQIRNEIWRWQALLDGKVRAKHGNIQFDIDFANPAGHRVDVLGGSVAAPEGWYRDDYDPFDDIFAMADMLDGKGYKISRMFTTRAILSVLKRNPRAARRLGNVTINYDKVTGELTPYQGRVTNDQIVEILRAEGFTISRGIETNDQTYNTRMATRRFFHEDAIMFACTTGRTEEYPDERGENDKPLIITDTLGYLGVGTPAGQDSAGRVLNYEAILNKKPPRVEVEGWQTSGPVVLDPEAIGVLRIKKPV